MSRYFSLLIGLALAGQPIPVEVPETNNEPVVQAPPYDPFEYDENFLQEPATTRSDEDDDLWNDQMQDFQADLMVTFEVPAGSQEFFYADVKAEDIKTPAALLRGAFFVSHNPKEQTGIDFAILDPNHQPIFSREGKGESIFVINATLPGTWTFSISNTKWLKGKQVTFIVGAGNRQTLKKEHIDNIEDRVKAVDVALREIQQEGAFLWTRQKSIMGSMEKINTKVFWFTIAEFIVLAIVAIVQVYSTKGLLSYRRLY